MTTISLASETGNRVVFWVNTRYNSLVVTVDGVTQKTDTGEYTSSVIMNAPAAGSFVNIQVVNRKFHCIASASIISYGNRFFRRDTSKNVKFSVSGDIGLGY